MNDVNSNGARESAYLATLSTLLFSASRGISEPTPGRMPVERALQYVSQLGDDDLKEFFHLADVHHVTIRALEVLKRAAATCRLEELDGGLELRLAAERKRISTALEFLDAICRALQAAGCPVIVIKSLDHWPDLGGDLDLFTSGERQEVIQVLTRECGARVQPQSWGDRLADKWNFQIPGLPELVECHVKCLGQTGEHLALARRLEQRQVERNVGGYVFPVAAPEERIIIAALQRMYRHFYIRLCDLVNIAALIRNHEIDYTKLKEAAELGAIWPGVATLLVLVTQYAKDYGDDVEVPFEFIDRMQYSGVRTFVSRQFLRIPILPDGARLYTQQMISTGATGDLRALARLSLLPALATAAYLGTRITGSDKGIW
jgi:hypothetical protein